MMSGFEGLLLVVGVVILSFVSVFITLFVVHVIMFTIARTLITIKPFFKFLNSNCANRNKSNPHVYNIQQIKNIKDFIYDFYVCWIPFAVISESRKYNLIPDTYKKHGQNCDKNTPHMVNKVIKDEITNIFH